MCKRKQFLACLVTGLLMLFQATALAKKPSDDAEDPSTTTPALSELADRPLYLAGGRGVPGNLVLTPSVEYPTIQSLANLGNYSRDTAFVGYFDPEKCYLYSYSDTESERHFYPSSIASDRACSGVGEWSGNFLNWATTQTIDPFRKALTGGYRVKDTSTETWLEKARHPGQSGIADRSISGTEAARATPFSDSSVSIRIEGMEKSMQFVLGDRSFESRGDENLKDYDPDNFPYRESDDDDNTYAYQAAVRVKVCDESVGLETNCVEYDSSWKPEGLIQSNAETLRYSVFGYLNDSSNTRDGAVLRAGQRDVTDEWDPATGIIDTNPDSASEGNSGVINYINKFGQLNEFDHKALDPVSELYYAATRYLKNQGNVSAYSDILTDKFKDGFPVITDWDDPMIYECQATAILGIGDVNSHDDGNLPGSSYQGDEPTMPSEVSADNTVNVTTMTNRVGTMEGLGNNLGEGEFTGRENTAYIAGLAYDNHINDMRPDLEGEQLASTHWVDVVENEALKGPASNQYYLAAKYGGFTVPDDYDENRTEALPEEWWTTGEIVSWGNTSFKRPENFYIAGDATRMVESLGKAFENIVTDAIGSSTGVTFNTATIETDTLLFGAEFNSANWSGNLYATAVTETADGPPSISDEYEWEAGEELDARDLVNDPRNIYTYTGTSGVEFTEANLTSFSQSMQDDLSFGGDSDLAEDRISYLRGNEVQGFRVRTSLLGDIVDSTPVYVQKPSLSWPNAEPFGEPAANETSPDKFYANFRGDQVDRDGVVYVGANDGMLHAFSAENGEELFAYIPEFLASNADQEGLHYLSRPAYSHRYYADLTPVVSDVFTEGASDSIKAWRTILIGGARTGGKGIFALDVTDPSGFANGSNTVPMWEFSSDDDDRMGYVTEPPTIGLADWGGGDYRWTAFLPNGYLSTTPATGVFMLDIEGGLDGEWTEDTDYQFIEFQTGTGASGLSPLRQVDLTGDRIIDRIYAGDLNGNIWVAADGGNQGWDDAYGGPLFTASVSGEAQPITAAPMVIRYPDEEEVDDGNNGNNKKSAEQKIMVLFGTGKYLEESDVTTTATQSFYGVFDGTAGLDRSDLVGRTLDNSTVTVDGETYEVRSSSGDDFVTTTYQGWYVDLIDDRERINQPAQVRGNYIFVNSLVPSDNPCDIGGGGWIMAFGLDGRTPDRAVWPKLGEPFVGFKTEGGIPNVPALIGDYALIPRSDSEILSEEIEVGRQTEQLGRMSWQELYE